MMQATTDSTSAHVTESVPGGWLQHPVTGEILHLLSVDADGRRLEADLWLQPGAALARAHVHDNLVERFELHQGKLGMLLGGDERTVLPGDGVVEVPAGTAHDWWNAGDEPAHVRATVEATPEAAGRPAARWLSMIEAVFSLGALGKVNTSGVPDPIWLAAIAREYRDAIRVTKPPAAVQAALFGPLAAVARLLGRDPLAPELHGPHAACAIPDPGEDGLKRMLAQPAGR